jgi:hypothetical protein
MLGGRATDDDRSGQVAAEISQVLTALIERAGRGGSELHVLSHLLDVARCEAGNAQRRSTLSGNRQSEGRKRIHDLVA